MTTIVANSRTDRKQTSLLGSPVPPTAVSWSPSVRHATGCGRLRPHPVGLAVLDHVTVTFRVTVVALPQLSVAIRVIV